jgi:hypothetical protein
MMHLFTAIGLVLLVQVLRIARARVLARRRADAEQAERNSLAAQVITLLKWSATRDN